MSVSIAPGDESQQSQSVNHESSEHSGTEPTPDAVTICDQDVEAAGEVSDTVSESPQSKTPESESDTEQPISVLKKWKRGLFKHKVTRRTFWVMVVVGVVNMMNEIWTLVYQGRGDGYAVVSNQIAEKTEENGSQTAASNFLVNCRSMRVCRILIDIDRFCLSDARW